MKENMIIPTNMRSVEAAKTASLWCKELFPDWCMHPFQGELQNVIRFGWEVKANEETIKNAGNWWLWMRNIFIENTMTKSAKEKMMKQAVKATTTQPLNFVVTRSPEWLHAQVGIADPELPRSRAALVRLNKVINESSVWIPTTGQVLLADIAITNSHKIAEIGNISSLIEENLIKLTSLGSDMGSQIHFDLLSKLPTDEGPLGNIVDIHGQILKAPPVPKNAWALIKTVVKETEDFHVRILGWTPEKSERHAIDIAMTMGLVGKSLNEQTSNILLHMERFISRGTLNNILNPQDDPLPVICLNDLLESKAVKR